MEHKTFVWINLMKKQYIDRLNGILILPYMTFNVHRSIWTLFGVEGFVLDQHKVVPAKDIYLFVPSEPLTQSQNLFEFIKIQFVKNVS